MEKRVLLAIFLSFLVLYAYQSLFVKSPAPKGAVARQGQRTAGAAGTAPPAQAASAQTGTLAPPRVETPSAPAPVLAEAGERDVTVETEAVTAVFTNRGARLKSWKLKRFTNLAGQPLDLVPPDLIDAPKPFALRFDDPDLTRRVNDALFRIVEPAASDSETIRVDGRRSRARVAFEYRDASGFQARKTFVLEPDSYLVALTADVNASGRALNPAIELGPWQGDPGNPSGSNGYYVSPPEAIFFREGKVLRVAAAKIAEEGVHEGAFRFAGADDHYFLSTAIEPGAARVEYRAVPPPPGAPNTTRTLVAYSIRLQKPPSDARFFVGPKVFDELKAVDPELVRTINFGMFAWLAVPLLSALKGINAYVGNYGWSIITLTILINGAMFPLRHKSVVSMRKMQELQPEVKAIQDRYAKLKTTDPARQKMNVELMNLYRERGVNPASGCIPMLLTMPVLFAFYSLLSQAIEIRGAPFTFWIKDLSTYDPYYVTPLLMGASMVWQQAIMPTSADPMQQKVMMIMPVVFTFMFLWAPSGLVIYWLVSNLWAIGQQQLTNKLIGPPVVRAPRPPAERKLKKVGESKSQGAAARG